MSSERTLLDVARKSHFLKEFMDNSLQTFEQQVYYPDHGFNFIFNSKNNQVSISGLNYGYPNM